MNSRFSWPDLTTPTYQRLVLNWAQIGRKHPYIGLTDPDQITNKLLIGSLLVSPLLMSGRTVYDIGSGVGIPALPISLAHPARPVWAIEPRNQCVSLLRWLCQKLSTSSLRIRNEPLDHVPFQRMPPGQLVTRAALDWSELGSYLTSRRYQLDPLIRWSGPNVDPPPPVSGYIRAHITVHPPVPDDTNLSDKHVDRISQQFYWWGSSELFHVKQRHFDQLTDYEIIYNIIH